MLTLFYSRTAFDWLCVESIRTKAYVIIIFLVWNPNATHGT